MTLYKTLKQTITINNRKYDKLNELVYAQEDQIESMGGDVETNQLVINFRRDRKQHIRNYARELSNILIQNPTQLTKRELPLFDLVPYTVWRRTTEKAKIIIRTLNDQTDSAKEIDE